MNREDIIRMAREAGFMSVSKEWFECFPEEIERFARLIETAATEAANARANASWTLMCEKMVAAEREACAKVCDELIAHVITGGDAVRSFNYATNACAALIRERGQK